MGQGGGDRISHGRSWRSVRIQESLCALESRLIGSGAGDFAPTPSHTTGHAAFRIRRWVRPEVFLPRHADRQRRTRRPVGGLRPSAGRWSVRGRDRSGHAPCFVRSCVARSSTTVGSVRSFGPSPRDACLLVRLFLATMASEDSPTPLSAKGLPRVRVSSVRSRRWARQHVARGSWASWSLAPSPSTSGLPAPLCSFGRALASGPFTPALCGDDLAVRLRLIVAKGRASVPGLASKARGCEALTW